MRVIFLDRDGVINRYPGDRDYVKSWQEFRFLPDVFPALRLLKDAEFLLFIISNQAGVGKGIFSQEALTNITKNMEEELVKNGIRLSGVYYCTHRSEDNCNCRKPKLGMLEKAIKECGLSKRDLDLNHSFFIGDTLIDVQTGKNFGVKTVLVFSGRERPDSRKDWSVFPDFTADNLKEAAELIVNISN